MKKNKKKNNERNVYKIIIVGTGGTGGAVASLTARYLYSKMGNEENVYNMVLVDGDTVDEKNINRQPFSSDDVGSFKVDCLSEAYREVYGINVNAFPVYIDDVEEFQNIFNYQDTKPSSYYSTKYHTILIGAVDNHRARQTMHEFFSNIRLKENTDLLYIDSANEFDFGTIVAGYKDSNNNIICPDRTFFFPDVLTSKEKKASELSCGEINISAPQHYATNQQAACIVFSQLCSFIEYGKYSTGVTYFHSFNLCVNHRSLDDYLADTYKAYDVDNYVDLCKKLKNKEEGEVNEYGR